MNRSVGQLLFLLLLSMVAPARAQFSAWDFATSGCVADLGTFRSSFEPGDAAVAFGGASGGSGGAFPGDRSMQVFVPGTGQTHTVLLYLPAAYSPQQAWPSVLVLHGAAGSAEQAPFAAADFRAFWSGIAEREGAVLVVPIASGNAGGWLPSVDAPAIGCATSAVAQAYNLDLDRRYLWGFSAGAHVGHAVALGNAGRFAAYAVNAGALWAAACSQPGTGQDCAQLLPQVVRRVPVSLRVGDQDPLRPYAAGDAQRFQQAGWETGEMLLYAEFPGGHQIDFPDIEAAWTWFEPRRLPR